MSKYTLTNKQAIFVHNILCSKEWYDKIFIQHRSTLQHIWIGCKYDEVEKDLLNRMAEDYITWSNLDTSYKIKLNVLERGENSIGVLKR